MVSTGVRWSGVAAVAFGVATAPVVVLIGPMFDFALLPTLSIPLSAMLTGGVAWFYVVEAEVATPVKNGAIAGVLTGVFSHFPYWLLAELTHVVSVVRSTRAEPQIFESIGLWLGTAVFSTVVIGWLSAPLGLIAGMLVGYLRKRSK